MTEYVTTVDALFFHKRLIEPLIPLAPLNYAANVPRQNAASRPYGRARRASSGRCRQSLLRLTS